MKRMHVHVSVQDLPQSIGFYSALFDAEPAVVNPHHWRSSTRCPGVIDKKNAENFDDEASEEDDEEA
jgi:hypothetical protein